MKSLTALLTLLVLSGTQANAANNPDDFATALTSLTPIRLTYSEVFQNQGVRPLSLAELGIDESYLQDSLISHVDIEPVSGSIMIGLSPSFGQNEWLALVPKFNSSNPIQWTCQTTVPESFVVNTGCRANVSYEGLTTLLDSSLFLNTLRNTINLRINAADSLQSTGQFPESMADLGVDQAWLDSSNVDHIIVEPNSNTILLGLSDLFGTNQWLALIPTIRYNSYITRWSYKTTLPASLVNISAIESGVKLEDVIEE